MNRREACGILLAAVLAKPARSEAAVVSTIIGDGAPGRSDRQVNNPYGLAFGRDGALYFCDLDNQQVRRLDLGRQRTAVVAGSGERGYSGDGGAAVDAALNMPHEVQFDRAGNLYIVERDNHVVRRVDAGTGAISTFAGTGLAGFSGDGGPAARARLSRPHSIVVDGRNARLLICDVGNQRIRSVGLTSGIIQTVGGTGEAAPSPDGAPLMGTPLNGPRTMVLSPSGDLYLALREGNAIYRIDGTAGTLHRVAGTGEQGYAGDGGPARLARLAGPKGLALATSTLFIADTENHAIRAVDLETGRIRTVLGTGRRGDGPETSPLQCSLSRPHGVCLDGAGSLFVSDSEAHRIRRLTL